MTTATPSVEPTPTAALQFSKMHGAGNDFVVLDRRDGRLPPPDAIQCRLLGDRHAGVGCDQILTIEPPRSADAVASYRIWNADGSSAGQCGNGARCVAAWLLRDGSAPASGFRLDSPGRSHAVEVLGNGHYRIDMGRPDFDPDRIPLHGFSRQPVYTLDQDDFPLHFGAVSMGNPHAVITVDDVQGIAIEPIATRLQQHAAFPESVNVGFVQVLSPERIRLRVYERGAGETLACGSGACAAAAVLMQRGLVRRTLQVALPGDALDVHWADDAAPLFLSGPAAFVFEGRLQPDSLAGPSA